MSHPVSCNCSNINKLGPDSLANSLVHMSLAQTGEKYTAQPPEHGFDFVISHRSILQQDRVSVSEPSGGEVGSKVMEEWSQDVSEQSGECHHTQQG